MAVQCCFTSFWRLLRNYQCKYFTQRF